MKERIKAWLMVARAPFLVLTPLLVGLGTAIALYEGVFNFLHFILALSGMLSAHIAGNMFNEYFDYKSGLDLKTKKTPFSGGSGTLPKGLLKAEDVYRACILCSLIASVIGAYFITVMGVMLLPLIIIAAISAYFYTTHFSKMIIGEFIAGLNFGPLAVLGAYFVQTGYYSPHALIASLAPGILGAALLVINQIPDAEEDRKVGRRHLVIFLGKKKSSRLYGILVAAAYMTIISGVFLEIMPASTLIALLALPIAFSAVRGALKDFNDMNALIPAMGANVKALLLMLVLLNLAYVFG